MNKIFKVVWSKVRNCYVVVSEIAKNTVSGVGKRNRIGKISLAATLAASVLTGGFFLPSEGLAAVSALTDSKPVYYIAIGNAKTNVNPLATILNVVSSMLMLVVAMVPIWKIIFMYSKIVNLIR